ncbi:MAG: PorV/PorQ family protein [Ignavibacteriales bacterium]|nr:PorV/PorQ family protein [Ignavibacteriales bacterium]
MKTMNIFMVLFLVLILGLNTAYAGAGNRTGTGGASQLLIPVGVRGISMGEQGVATSKGIEALFWNPAGISKMRNSTEVIFSHMNYIADIGLEYGAVASNVTGFGTVALSVKSLSVGDIPVTTTRDPDGNGTMFSPQYITAGLSFSRLLSDKISVGLTANFVTESLGNASASGLAFDIGVMYDNLADLSGLSFGIVLKNLGPQMKYDGSALYVQADVTDFGRPPQYYKITTAGFELPTVFQLGFGYRPQIDEVNNLLASVSFQNNNFSDDEYRLGLEYGYKSTFFIRGGYSLAPQALKDNYIYGLTAGLGVNYEFEGIDLKVDYAYRDVKYFDANHIFSIGVGF